MSQLQTVLDALILLGRAANLSHDATSVEAEAIAIVKQMMQAEPIPVPDDIAAGALYDFLGYLTTRRTRITMSDRDEAGPAVDALVDWSKTRKINLVEARVRDWNVFTAPQAVPAWLPISSAQKDGTSMLVYHNRMVLEAWYSLPCGKFVVAESGGTNNITPTHWMPLPSPPKVAA